MRRDDAIEWVARHEVGRLELEQRDSLQTIPTMLCCRTRFVQGSWRVIPATTPRIPCTIHGCSLLSGAPFKGVVKSYLETRLAQLGYSPRSKETSRHCSAVCCGLLRLPERGHCDICEVCFWEDDGTTALDRVSGPNHLTVAKLVGTSTRSAQSTNGVYTTCLATARLATCEERTDECPTTGQASIPDLRHRRR
jgi:hypothetical protein